MGYEKYRVRLPKKMIKQRPEERNYGALKDVVAPWAEDHGFEIRSENEVRWLARSLSKVDAESLKSYCTDQGFDVDIVSQSTFFALLLDSGIGGTLIAIFLVSPLAAIVPILWLFFKDLAWERGALPLAVYLVSLVVLSAIMSREPALLTVKKV